MKIVVQKRSDDYKAHLAGCTEVWDAGKNPAEAIGNLLITHKKELGVEIEEQ